MYGPLRLSIKNKSVPVLQPGEIILFSDSAGISFIFPYSQSHFQSVEAFLSRSGTGRCDGECVPF